MPGPRNLKRLCLHALVIGARRRKRADSAVTLMWGAVRSYESIDARPSTLRRLGVVALALVAGFVALSRTTALSPTAARDALLGASSGVGV